MAQILSVNEHVVDRVLRVGHGVALIGSFRRAGRPPPGERLSVGVSPGGAPGRCREDVLQQTFIAAWKAARWFRGEARVRTYHGCRQTERRERAGHGRHAPLAAVTVPPRSSSSNAARSRASASLATATTSGLPMRPMAGSGAMAATVDSLGPRS